MIIAEKSTFLELGSEFYRNPFVSSSIRALGHSLKATSRQFVFQFFLFVFLRFSYFFTGLFFVFCMFQFFCFSCFL